MTVNEFYVIEKNYSWKNASYCNSRLEFTAFAFSALRFPTAKQAYEFMINNKLDGEVAKMGEIL